jgi:hypothetical protein
MGVVALPTAFRLAASEGPWSSNSDTQVDAIRRLIAAALAEPFTAISAARSGHQARAAGSPTAALLTPAAAENACNRSPLWEGLKDDLCGDR